MESSLPIDFEHDIVAVLDRAGYIRFVSPPPKGYQGARRPEEVIGHHIGDFVHPDDVRHFENWLVPEFSAAQPGSSATHFMFRVRRPDQSWRWLEATLPQLEGHHTVDHIILFLRDIAAHRLVEGQYQLAESIAGFGLWSIGRNSTYADLSSGMIRLLGFEPGELATTRKFWPLSQVESGDVPLVLNTLRRAFEAPGKFSFTCAAFRKDGSRRIFKTRGYVRSDVVGKDQLFGISQDVTQIHLAEERLRASEEEYRLLTQRASDIICRLTPSGTIEFISPSVFRLTGRRPSRLIGLNFNSLLPEQESGKFESFLARVRGGEEGFLCTVRFRGLRAGESWLELSGRTLKDELGRVYGLVCAGRDISERKQFELELQAARERAEEISASKSKFLSHISHELRTPLNAILGFSEMIRDSAAGVSGEKRYAEYGTLIHESGRILSALINDLLDLSKIEAGKYEIEPERVALEDVVPVCLQQIRPQAMQKNIAVRDNISGMHLNLRVDRKALIQILINLLSNAVKFTPDGGRVDLFGRREGGRIRLDVRDTGIGIEKADIARITEPFEQVTDNGGRTGEGTGLGLALVKSLVELHGGDLLIESEPGKGTTVSVILPTGVEDKAVA